MIAKVDGTGGAFCDFARHAATMVVVPYGLSYNLHRWSMESRWETCGLVADFDWKKTTEPVMRLYTEATDGSYIERKKESALVWHHDEADPDFGSCQAKELLDHLESVLANEPVVVKRGQHIVEVNPQDLREKVKNKEKYFDVSRMVEGRGNSLDVVKPLEL